jgi:ferric-dicitrate binding protein FerR (iron transport regulator)
MSRCLSDPDLLALEYDAGAPEVLLHVRACARCSGRHRALTRDLALIAQALASPPSPAALAGRAVARRPSPLLRRVATGAAVVALVLIAEAGLWRVSVHLTQPDGGAANVEAMQLLDDASAELLGTPRDVVLSQLTIDRGDGEGIADASVTDLVADDRDEP